MKAQRFNTLLKGMAGLLFVSVCGAATPDFETLSSKLVKPIGNPVATVDGVPIFRELEVQTEEGPQRVRLTGAATRERSRGPFSAKVFVMASYSADGKISKSNPKASISKAKVVVLRMYLLRDVSGQGSQEFEEAMRRNGFDPDNDPILKQIASNMGGSASAGSVATLIGESGDRLTVDATQGTKPLSDPNLVWKIWSPFFGVTMDEQAETVKAKLCNAP